MSLPAETELDTASIVLVGSFNPAIFQPMWFAAHEMLSEKDAEDAEIKVIHPDITQFQTRQIRLSIEQNRFRVSCESIHRNIIRDLVLTCFGSVLVHCPIRMLGLNRELHFSCGSEEKRSTFGFMLAPLEPWGKWGTEIAKSVGPEPRHGGMVGIQMRQQPRPDKRRGYIQADIRPSNFIRNDSGIFIQINDHFEFDPDQEHPTRHPMEALEEAWEPATIIAEEIIGEVMQKAVGK